MTLSLTVIMVGLMALLIAKFELKWFHALICVLAGLTLGGTEVGNYLLGGLNSLGTAIAQMKF